MSAREKDEAKCQVCDCLVTASQQVDQQQQDANTSDCRGEEGSGFHCRILLPQLGHRRSAMHGMMQTRIYLLVVCRVKPQAITAMEHSRCSG